MKVLRSSVIGAVAIFAAACGDKVNVVGPDTTPPPAPVATVNSVTIAPATATLSIGQTIGFTAVVDVSNGAAQTVTWSSSDATKVSVSATGTATAVAATPGVAICARSTVNTTKQGCASVVVTAAATVTPATISIASITTGNNLNQPVDPSAVAGQIDVRVNVNPGTSTVTKVRLNIGGVAADSQTFSAAQAASLRYAADQAAAEQSTFPQIVFSVNTAAYAAATGVPRYTNGSKAIAVQLFTSASATAAAATATGETLTFANPDLLTAKFTPLGGTFPANVNAVNGLGWSKLTDSVDVQILPISYSGRAFSTIAMRPVCGDSVWTKVASPFTVRYRVPAAGYQTTDFNALTNNASGCSATATTTDNGEAPVLVSATMVDGNSAPALAFDATTLATLRRRWDNMGPSMPTITQQVGVSGTRMSRGVGWLNDDAKLTAVRTTSSEGSTVNFTGALITGRGTDLGVSAGVASTDAQAITYKAYLGTDLAAALASTARTNTLGLAETVGQTMCLVVRGVDALGNQSPAPTTCNFNSGTNTAAEFVGIDRTVPNYARYQPRGADTAAGVYNKFAPDSLWAGGRIAVFAGDTNLAPGGVGASGIRGVAFSISRTDNAATTCLLGTSSSCTVSTTGVVTAPLGTNAWTDDFASSAGGANFATDGYYSIGATAYDNAGNAVVLASRNVMRDGVAPASAAVVGLNAIQSGLQSGRVTIASDDAVGLAAVQLTNSYSDGVLTLSYLCARTDIATTMAAASLVVSDARALTGCSAPASLLLKTDTIASTLVNFPGTLLLPNSAGNAAFNLSANATATTIDWSGQRTSNAVALNTVGLPDTTAAATGISGVMGTNGQRANTAAICPNAFNGMGFCNFTVSRSGTSVFTGTGSNAATSTDLRGTVSVQDSIAMPGASSDSTAAQRKTAALTNLRNNVTASPFRSVTFLVYPAVSCISAGNDQFGANANCTGAGAGVAEGVPVGTAPSLSAASPGVLVTGALDATVVTNSVTGLLSELVDSTTNATMYVVNRTWRYVGAFSPDKYLGTFVPMLGRTTDFTSLIGTVRFYGIGNYGFPSTSSGSVIFPQAGTLNAGVWQLGGVNAAGTNTITSNNAAVSTTRRSRIAVLSPRGGAISVRR